MSPCLLSEVNLLRHKALHLEGTEKMVSVKKNMLDGQLAAVSLQVLSVSIGFS